MATIFRFLIQFESLSKILDDPIYITRIIGMCRIMDNIDVQGFVDLKPLPDVKAENVELLGLNFCFAKDKTVLFPLSPFLFRATAMLDEITRATKLQEYGFDQWPTQLTHLYCRDVICIGCSLPIERYELFQRIVEMKFPNAFDSISRFHSFVSESLKWLHIVVKFSNESFENEKLYSPLVPSDELTIQKLITLSSVDGVVPLSRVHLLEVITERNPQVDWQVLRAMAVIDSNPSRPPHEVVQERRNLSNLNAIFSDSCPKGWRHSSKNTRVGISNIFCLKSSEETEKLRRVIYLTPC